MFDNCLYSDGDVYSIQLHVCQRLAASQWFSSYPTDCHDKTEKRSCFKNHNPITEEICPDIISSCISTTCLIYELQKWHIAKVTLLQ